eukprot:358576-Chlamydomonas_euryale.AAC.1
MFVAASLVESALLLSGGLPRGAEADAGLDLSEQELVACVNQADSPFRGHGCGGGWVDANLEYAAWRGLSVESAWRYADADSECAPSPPTPSSGRAVLLSAGASRVRPSRSEAALRAALRTGPVGVLIHSGFALMVYSGGVFEDSGDCSSAVNHAVVLVGYGYDSDSDRWFWKAKNSWGTRWGEGGYFRIAMTGDGDGPCGIYQWAYTVHPDAKFVNEPLLPPYS